MFFTNLIFLSVDLFFCWCGSLQLMIICGWNSSMMHQTSWTIIKWTINTEFDGLVLNATLTNDCTLFKIIQLFNEFIFLQLFHSTFWYLKFNLTCWTFWRILWINWRFQTFQTKTMSALQYSWVNHQSFTNITNFERNFFHLSKKIVDEKLQINGNSKSRWQ